MSILGGEAGHNKNARHAQRLALTVSPFTLTTLKQEIV
jgi:hypothetical protein